MPDPQALRSLVATVGAFYVRDRALQREQKKIEEALATGTADEALARSYLSEVRRYFSAFDKEAHAQLKRVDRELERLYQLQYNLTAERGVAARRVEATQGVLSTLAEIGAR
ncbi:MAG: hypothetical protein NVSMB5_07560 [Candidatus Velthaea sp.]